MAFKPGNREIRKEVHFKNRVINCFADRPERMMQKIGAVISRYPDKVAIVDEKERLTYSELDTRVSVLADYLSNQGLVAGARVGLLIPNKSEFVVSLLAIWRVGGVPVPINVREAAPETAFILNNCEAQGLIYDPGFDESIPSPEDVPGLDWSLPTQEIPRQGPAGRSYADAAKEDDLACILYTSGTTGKPKGAMLTHLNLIHSMLHYEHHLGINHEDTSLLVVPATHITGLVGLVLATIGAGAKLVIMEAFNTRSFLDTAVRERMTYTIMVPAMYNLLLMREALENHDLSSWRVGAFGGAVMSPEAIRSLAKFLPGLELVNAYGATETASPTSFVPLGDNATHLDTIGKPVACAEILIMDESGQECRVGETGELWIRGPMVIPGYWNRPDANDSEFISGYWRSGDICEIDEQGYLRIHDRKKDLVNRGGYKIFSSEVENVLLAHESVSEAAVVARPCPVLGERVHAFVQVLGNEVDEADLRAFCAKELADYKVPETFTFSSSPLPRNANGKLLKRQLKDMVGE